MRTTIALGLVLAASLAGCQQKAELDEDARPRFDAVKTGDLTVSVEVSDRTLQEGQTFRVTIRALATGDEPIRVPSTTGAPAYVDLYRHTGLGWEKFHTYPEAAIMVMSPWTLTPGVEWTHTLTLTVEPSWPTHEMIRVEARLNGLDDVTPSVQVEVRPGQADPNQPE